MRSEAAAYCSGFFDGEGSVDIRWRLASAPNGKKYERFELRVCVPQVVREPLDLMRDEWGGSVKRRKRGDCHEWVITGAGAAKFLGDIAPWLIVKADEAEIALRFASTMRDGVVNTPGSKGVDRLDDDIRRERMECHLAIRTARLSKGIKGRPNAVTAPAVRDAVH